MSAEDPPHADEAVNTDADSTSQDNNQTPAYETTAEFQSLEQQFHVYTIVHRGSLHDANHERRIGLWFLPHDAGSQFYFHVKGDFSRFIFEVKLDWDPTCTGSAMEPVYVGSTRRLTAARLHAVLRSVPIENHDLEFNGQQWIWGALEYLTCDGYLSREQRDKGFNSMLDQVLDGSSDELSNRPSSRPSSR